MRILKSVVPVVLVVAIVYAALMYTQPLWVQRQQAHFGLLLARVNSNYVATPEGRVHYYEAEAGIPGGGVPLVLVHGLADRDESWGPMLKLLKDAGFHVYAPDLLGYGRSPKPADSDYSIATEEQFVADFIKALGLQKPDIGGWSMGGWITLTLALDHPEMVDRVIIYDGSGMSFDSKTTESGFRPRGPEDIDRLVYLLGPGVAGLPGYVKRDVLRNMAENQWIVDRSMASMANGANLLNGRLNNLTRPLLIVWGSEDRLLPLAVGEQMHALVPASTLDVIEGCGHLAPSTCASRTAMATAFFLKSYPPPAGAVHTLKPLN